MDSMDYPPEPWDLHGHGYVSIWRVPAADLPPLPAGLTPVTLFGKAMVGTAFVDYLPGSMVAYHELLAAVLVRRGRRLGVTITHIWVDNPVSKAGARAMWGIPKELAEFELTHEPSFSGVAKALASARFWPRPPALRLPARMTVVQTLHGALRSTPVRATARLGLARATWELVSDGSLSWLRSGRPMVSVAIRDFRMSFGR
jgi:hypothetical protein